METKELAITRPLGTDGNFKASLSVVGDQIEANVKVQYPVMKLVEPIMGVADSLVDKLEQLIPGDQKAMAQAAKADFRAAILKAIQDQVAVKPLVEDAQLAVEAPKAE